MKFIDPFRTACEFCKDTNFYPVKALLSYEAHCKQCGKKLIEGPLSMHQSIRLVKIDLWPISLLWEACEAFDLDLDCISDTEFDNMCLVKDFMKILYKMGFKGEPDMILTLPKLQILQNEIEASKLGEYRIEELALLANPEVKPSF